MRRALTAAAAALALLALTAPPLSADGVVHAVGANADDYGTYPDRFLPATIRIAPGESVSFVNDLGVHNVKFDDGQFTAPAAPADPSGWPATPPTRSFPQAGTYRFYCEMHGGPGGIGMSGAVLVGTQATAPPVGLPAPGSGSPGAGGGGGMGAQASIESISLPSRRFCARRSRRCRRPGVRFRINLSGRARVKGALKRRPLRGGRARRFGTLDFGSVAAGGRLLRFTRTGSGRRLKPGRYVLTITAGRDRRVLRFTVVS